MSNGNTEKPKPTPQSPQPPKEPIPLDPGWMQIVKKGGNNPGETKEKPSKQQNK